MTTLHHAQKDGKKFLNPVPTILTPPGGFFKILGQYISNKAEVVPKQQLPHFKTDTSIYQTPPVSGLRITWIGHSSLLIEIDGYHILTDPVWSERASFVSWAGPKRFFPPTLPLEELPLLDAVILSHDHYDHLDRATIKKFANSKTLFYCSLGVGNHLLKWGIAKNRITELDWTDSVTIGKDLKLTATPARHFSGRGIIGREQTLWSSFVIKSSKHNIFFGADSGWFEGFKDIGDAYGPFDLTMLEIGAYGENWPNIHMGPINAVNANLALRGKVMLPIHWGTFNLALHAWREPVERLIPYAAKNNVTLILPTPGQPLEVIGEGYNSRWWEK